MEQHPIPRQITTFEFKLIGFLTIKQFIYLVVFLPSGFIVYTIFPVPVLNILLAILVGGFGVVLAFVPVNDRPLEIWIRNLVKRLKSPTQYLYHKNETPLYFLDDLVIVGDPHVTLTHIDSQEKLAAYLNKTAAQKSSKNKQQVANLLHHPSSALTAKTIKTNIKLPSVKPAIPQKQAAVTNATPLPASTAASTAPAPTSTAPLTLQKNRMPFFTGVVKNHKLLPLPGILLYVKDIKGNVLRLLKTNPHGIFATFNPLPSSEYFFEIKDPRNTYFFDTMKIKVEGTIGKPLEFFSKEML